MNGLAIHCAHDLEETVRHRNASGGGQILNMRRFRTSFPAGHIPKNEATQRTWPNWPDPNLCLVL
jgi:hypothetical protein